LSQTVEIRQLTDFDATPPAAESISFWATGPQVAVEKGIHRRSCHPERSRDAMRHRVEGSQSGSRRTQFRDSFRHSGSAGRALCS